MHVLRCYKCYVWCILKQHVIGNTMDYHRGNHKRTYIYIYLFVFFFKPKVEHFFESGLQIMWHTFLRTKGVYRLTIQRYLSITRFFVCHLETTSPRLGFLRDLPEASDHLLQHRRVWHLEVRTH